VTLSPGLSVLVRVSGVRYHVRPLSQMRKRRILVKDLL